MVNGPIFSIDRCKIDFVFLRICIGNVFFQYLPFIPLSIKRASFCRAAQIFSRPYA
jgi:5'-3' exonuclease